MKKLPVLFGILLLSAVMMSLTDKPVEGLQVGDIAPQIDLKGVDGKNFSFEPSEEIKGWIVTFTCNTCPYAVLYEDRLIALHNEMAPKGWPVIAINPNDPAAQPGDSFDKMIERAKEKNFPFKYLFDEGQHVYPDYGASRTPHVFLLDKTRKVRYIGAIDDSARDPEAVNVRYVAEAIKAIENGQEPNPSFTKAIGCSIKSL
ncbi:MAG: thioredoxin family protein [Saprospiraceae bacterium]|nr:thioredoxin family protein [Saprospiraceae bacterium]MCB9322450.1 thioredoxin family protein [Lewinellaceae bacterium]